MQESDRFKTARKLIGIINSEPPPSLLAFIIQNHKKTVKPCHSAAAYRPLTRHPHLLNTTTARMLFLPSHCVTCVRKTRWRIIILCLLYNLTSNVAASIFPLSAATVPSTGELIRASLAGASHCGVIHQRGCRQYCFRGISSRAVTKRTNRPFFSERIHQLTISPLRDGFESIKVSCSCLFCIRRQFHWNYILPHMSSHSEYLRLLFTVLTVENDSFMSSLSYHIFDASTDCVCFQYCSADADHRPRFWVKRGVTAIFFPS